jgi:hypothetical protein
LQPTPITPAVVAVRKDRCESRVGVEDKGFAQGRGEETEEYIFRLDGEIQ